MFFLEVTFRSFLYCLFSPQAYIFLSFRNICITFIIVVLNPYLLVLLSLSFLDPFLLIGFSPG